MSHGHMDPLMTLSFLWQSCTFMPSVHGMSLEIMDSFDGMDLVQRRTGARIHENLDDYYSGSVWEHRNAHMDDHLSERDRAHPDLCMDELSRQFGNFSRSACEGTENHEIVERFFPESSRCFGCGSDTTEYHTLQFESIKAGQEMRIKNLACWHNDAQNQWVNDVQRPWNLSENRPNLDTLHGHLHTMHARQKAEGVGEASLPLAATVPVSSTFGDAPLVYYRPFNTSRYEDFGTYNTIVLHPSAKVNSTNKTVGLGSIVNAAWYHLTFCAASPNNHCGLGSGTGGNVFGGWGLFLADKKFKAAPIDVRDISPTMAERWRILPYKILQGDFELLVHWPATRNGTAMGAFATFDFENYADDRLGKYAYVRNYVLNPQQQNGAFVETHPFPHIFNPMRQGAGAKIILARPLEEDTLDTNVSFYASMVAERPEERHHTGRFEFFEFAIPFGYGLVVGSNVMHSDSATEGPLATLMDLNYKGANSAKMHIPTTGNDLTSVHSSTMHKLFNPFTEVQNTLESGCGNGRPVKPPASEGRTHPG